MRLGVVGLIPVLVAGSAQDARSQCGEVLSSCSR
jgi:hypothetical protein